MNEKLIEFKNLTKYYGSKLVLNQLNLSLKKGRIIGLLGPNGSGKTTMIKIINGLLKSYQGEVVIDGKKIGKETKQMISYLPDESYFQDWMKAKDALNLFKDLYKDFNYEHCIELMTSFNLTPDMKIKTMSKGMKEKFQLCLVMSRKAKIYVLDEPIAGVDPAAREVILDLILNNYDEDALVLISTHLISDLEQIFDEVVFIKNGKLILHENVETLRSERQMSVDELFREVFRC